MAEDDGARADGWPSPAGHGIFPFDHDHAAPARDLVDLLGGKGAGLAEMSAALGLAVPPGFTISVPVCRVYRESGWPDGLEEALTGHITRLGEVVGRRFGDADDPLLLAVRSGAPVSMPGMLDTILDLGLNDETVAGLARRSGDELFAWDSYRRFLLMFATTVMDVPAERLTAAPAGGGADAMREHVAVLRDRIEQSAGRPVPSEPDAQLREAIEAVFRSWECGRARAYRAKEGIDEAMGTAVNVQAMVFGNRGPRSGTGVVFTRNPSTGEPGPYGDYLPQAQGEDVVAGTSRIMPISHLAEHQPAVYTELLGVLRRLEVHYRDVCDVEFTLEEGRLWLLQTRIGKRSAAAAVRIAVDLVSDPDIRLDPAEAVRRVPAPIRARARRAVLARVRHDGPGHDLLGTGLGASPGRVTGKVALSSDQAADAEGDVILVRPETSPEDVAGIAASAGVLTTRGGLVSHAAVVARGWGIPAVVGAHELTLADGVLRSAAGITLRAGDVITIDGASGQVWRGVVSAPADDAGRIIDEELPQLAVLEAWASGQAAKGLPA
jgi:pyruvate, orthophosphate dikinase